MTVEPDERRTLSLQENATKGIDNRKSIWKEGEDELGTDEATKLDPLERIDKKENKKWKKRARETKTDSQVRYISILTKRTYQYVSSKGDIPDSELDLKRLKNKKGVHDKDVSKISAELEGQLCRKQ